MQQPHNINIQVSVVDSAQRYFLQIPIECDFLILCSDGNQDWRGFCARKELQKCVERGIRSFDNAAA